MGYRNFITVIGCCIAVSACANDKMNSVELSSGSVEVDLCKTYLSEYDNLFSSKISEYNPSKKQYLIDLVYQVNLRGLDKESCQFLVSDAV